MLIPFHIWADHIIKPYIHEKQDIISLCLACKFLMYAAYPSLFHTMNDSKRNMKLFTLHINKKTLFPIDLRQHVHNFVIHPRQGSVHQRVINVLRSCFKIKELTVSPSRTLFNLDLITPFFEHLNCLCLTQCVTLNQLIKIKSTRIENLNVSFIQSQESVLNFKLSSIFPKLVSVTLMGFHPSNLCFEGFERLQTLKIKNTKSFCFRVLSELRNKGKNLIKIDFHDHKRNLGVFSVKVFLFHNINEPQCILWL